MGETVQKLTVKMPWSQKLKRAEVSEVHARSGVFVKTNQTILTLVTNTGRHEVRAAYEGRLVILVAPGDLLQEGDPLYVLRFEGPASAGAEAEVEESAPQIGVWRVNALSGYIGRRLGDWAWFLLALGIYAIAARLVIPWLPTWLQEESALGWLMIASGLSLTGFLVFRLLARRGGRTARRLTWGLAACWAILSFGGLHSQTGGFGPAIDEMRGLAARIAGPSASQTAEEQAQPAPEKELAAATKTTDDPASGQNDQIALVSDPTTEEAGAAEDPVATEAEEDPLPGTGIRVGPDLTALAPSHTPSGELASEAEEAPGQARLRLPDANWRLRHVLNGEDSPALGDLVPQIALHSAAASASRAAPDTVLAVVDPVGFTGGLPRPGWAAHLRVAPEIELIDAEAVTGTTTGAPDSEPVAPADAAEIAGVAEIVPLPYIPPRFARISLLFQYLEDPRDPAPPSIGDTYTADLPTDIALAVTAQEVSGMRAVVQVTGWCIAAGDATGIKRISTDKALYRQVGLSDRLRLVLVDVTIEADTIGMLSDALPVFGGAEPGFFHNRRPLMGGFSGPQLLERGQDWLGAQSNRLLDPNFPAFDAGGSFYFDMDELLAALDSQGCTAPVWQGGGPITALGRAVDQALTE